jgi:multidrug efflux pump subunit AcrA (membrane-fusion protein)
VARAQLDKAKTDAQNSFTQASSALTQAQIALQDAKTNYDRTKNLFDAGAASQQQLDQAATNLQTKQAAYDAALQQYHNAAPGGDPLNQESIKVAQAQVAQAEAAVANIQRQLDQATVTAPISGVVASCDVEVGEYASPQTAVVTLAQTNPVKATVQVPETAISQVKPGLAVRVVVPAAGQQEISGTLSRVSPVEDNATKSYPADVEIPNPDGRLKPGMVAQITIQGLTPVQGLVIPASALVQTPDGPKVFTVENNVAHQHLIQIGAVDSQHVQVLKGLKEGDVLVVAGQELLGEGAQVTVVQPGQAGGSGGGNAPAGQDSRTKGRGAGPAPGSGR